MNIYPSLPNQHIQSLKQEELWKSAQKLEVVFVSQMLKHSGYSEPMSSFGGGVGEEQFSSLLADYQAEAIVKTKGFGLAEKIFSVMAERVDEK